MITALNPLSISPKAKNWLKNTRQARVLHSFQAALNLINEHHLVLSLVTATIGNGPFSIVVTDVDFSRFTNAQTTIEISEQTLWIGNVQCSTHQTPLWTPQPDWGKLRAAIKTICTKIALIEAMLAAHVTRDGLGIRATHFIQKSDLLINNIAEIAREAILTLTIGLKTQNLSLIQDAANQLAGLGMGLTPAGDDYLMGVIYGLWLAFPRDFADLSAKLIYQIAQNKTNSLSAAWLQAAVDGETGELWHIFFHALAGKENAPLQNAFNNILATGHSSGADAMGGFLQTLNYAFIRQGF